ncbi:helix-turn-helix domain-containing protein [Rhizobium ecuadorense]|uniref:helix-turn-helix domain-containing protein n=1 Tax=Rhizobium ecuadorense TaxID=1671795 RepID=UPI000673285B|nr:helix-turn-helix domain-containing protein [Rhizobium ecuadorense]
MKGFAAWKFDLIDRMSTDHRLSATDFRVGYRLLHYMDAATGDCFPRQETIAADLGLTDRTVRNALVSLRACGWLTIEERPLPKGRGKSNLYHFEDASTGSTVPVNDATTGNSAQDFRKTASRASEEEHVEYNTLNRGEVRAHTPDRERGTRIPENFSPDVSVALDLGMTLEQAERSALNFRDYWRAAPGAAGRKLDWAATWRVWARNDAAKAARNWPDRQQRSNGNGSKPKQQDWAAFLKNESEHQRKGAGYGEAEPRIRPRLPPDNPR